MSEKLDENVKTIHDANSLISERGRATPTLARRKSLANRSARLKSSPEVELLR
jgi:hypothetical protein